MQLITRGKKGMRAVAVVTEAVAQQLPSLFLHALSNDNVNQNLVLLGPSYFLSY